MDAKACSKPRGSVEALKASIIENWSDMSEEYLINVCKAFRREVEVFEVSGGCSEGRFVFNTQSSFCSPVLITFKQLPPCTFAQRY